MDTAHHVTARPISRHHLPHDHNNNTIANRRSFGHNHNQDSTTPKNVGAQHYNMAQCPGRDSPTCDET
jgi:hypothetical protein